LTQTAILWIDSEARVTSSASRSASREELRRLMRAIRTNSCKLEIHLIKAKHDIQNVINSWKQKLPQFEPSAVRTNREFNKLIEGTSSN
jgi:predicted LPLAT superfamily acyltransferase